MNIQIFTFNPFQENTYVLYDDSHEAAIVDAGCLFPHEQAELQRFVTDQNLHVARVLNTHLHLDHQFGNRFVHDTWGISPEAHRQDEFLITTFPLQAQAFGLGGQAGEAQPLRSYIDDNEAITFGHTTLTALHVPGHSPGGLAFYCAAEGVLLSGDTLFRESVGRTDLAGGDHSTLLRSIATRLFTLPPDTVVLSGHGDRTTIGHERQHNPFARPDALP